MSHLARTDNNIITDIIVGDANKSPSHPYDVTGKGYGVGWFTLDNGFTFNPPTVPPEPNRMVLTRRELRKLFPSKNKWRQVKSSPNDDIGILWEIIEHGHLDTQHTLGWINLEEQDVIDGMDALIPAILSQAEHDLIMEGI